MISNGRESPAILEEDRAGPLRASGSRKKTARLRDRSDQVREQGALVLAPGPSPRGRRPSPFRRGGRAAGDFSRSLSSRSWTDIRAVLWTARAFIRLRGPRCSRLLGALSSFGLADKVGDGFAGDGLFEPGVQGTGTALISLRAFFDLRLFIRRVDRQKPADSACPGRRPRTRRPVLRPKSRAGFLQPRESRASGAGVVRVPQRESRGRGKPRRGSRNSFSRPRIRISAWSADFSASRVSSPPRIPRVIGGQNAVLRLHRKDGPGREEPFQAARFIPVGKEGERVIEPAEVAVEVSDVGLGESESGVLESRLLDVNESRFLKGGQEPLSSSRGDEDVDFEDRRDGHGLERTSVEDGRQLPPGLLDRLVHRAGRPVRGSGLFPARSRPGYPPLPGAPGRSFPRSPARLRRGPYRAAHPGFSRIRRGRPGSSAGPYRPWPPGRSPRRGLRLPGCFEGPSRRRRPFCLRSFHIPD